MVSKRNWYFSYSAIQRNFESHPWHPKDVIDSPLLSSPDNEITQKHHFPSRTPNDFAPTNLTQTRSKYTVQMPWYTHYLNSFDLNASVDLCLSMLQDFDIESVSFESGGSFEYAGGGLMESVVISSTGVSKGSVFS
jgi:hypothetical protein